MVDLIVIVKQKDVFFFFFVLIEAGLKHLQELLDLDCKLIVVSAIPIDSSGAPAPALCQHCQTGSSKFLQLAIGEKQVTWQTGMAQL